MALTFRRRIFVWLVVVAIIPASVGVAMALLAPQYAVPVGGVAAWDRAASTWLDAQRALARQP
ncbi:MAG TPA: hypothetical protein VMT77_10965, partial [Gemmatimonadales bacterium]|nr:hypothetical protein [Gemmatimonadales bacterium]